MICYIILTFRATRVRNNVISPSKIMYHDIFQKEKNNDFFETNAIKGMADKLYMHTYITLTLFMLLTLLESISFKNGTKRDLSLLCYNLIIKFCQDN